MAEDKSVVDSFLSEVNKNDAPLEEQNPFKDVTVEQKEVPVEDEVVKEEKPLPFNQDPKIQRFIQKEVERLTKNLTPREEQRFKEDVKEDGFVKAFETIIGNDTPEKVNALRMLKDEVEGIRQEARSAREEIQAEKQADIDAEKELAQGFENIEDEFDVDFTRNTKLRSEFVEFIEKIAPKDEDGEIKDYPDFRQTFALFQELNKKPQNVRNKELASRGMNRGGEATTAPIPADTSWRGVEKFFNTLKG